MRMINVSSDAIEAIGYDPASMRLCIRFTGGREYDFCGVPRHLYEQLMSAGSHGEFYNSHIRGRYQC